MTYEWHKRFALPRRGGNGAFRISKEPSTTGRGRRLTRRSRAAALGLSLLAALLFASSAQAATASWSLEPSSFDFGTRMPGAGPSAPAVFTLTNTGEVHLPSPLVDATTSTEGGPEPGAFEFVSDQCEGGTGLPPSASCTVEVTFDPLYPGPRDGRLTFSDPSSQVAPIGATYSGVGIGPIVSFSPPGGLTAVVGEGPSLPPKVLTVTNEGDADLSISAISLVGENANHFAIVGGRCQPGGDVAPGASCTIQVTYSPTAAGFVSGELQLTDNAARGFQIAGLQGIGVAPSPPRPVPLATFISQGPAKVSTRRFATFRFGVAGGHVRFSCKLDGRPYRACSSPQTYRHLALGHHVFRVRTLGRVEGVSPIPAVARFRVVPKKTPI